MLIIACASFMDTARASTWSSINAGLPAAAVSVVAITLSPAQPSTLYAQSVGPDGVRSLFKSTDGGASWSAISSVVGAGALAVDPQDPATIYAVAGSGILKSADGGGTWAATGPGLPAAYINVLVVDSASNLYVAGGGHIVKSADGGRTWVALDIGLSNPFLSSLVVDPADPSRLYALTPVPQNGGSQVALLRSTDGGQTWNLVPNALLASSSVTSLVISATAPSFLFAIAPSGPNGTAILKSADGGDSWSRLNPGLPTGAGVSALIIDPTNSSKIYLAVNFFFADAGGILQSADGGATWAAIKPDLPANTPLDYLAIDPSSPSTFYALADNGLLKSTDGGLNWSGVTAGLKTIAVAALAVSPVDASTLYTSAGNDVFKSLDGGASWNDLFSFQLFDSPGSFFPNGSPAYPRSLLIDFSNPDTLYLSTLRGDGDCYFADNLLFKSIDGGISWDNSISPESSGCLLGGFFGPSGGLKAMDPTDPRTLYVAEADDGDGSWLLLRTRDGGSTWNSLPGFADNFQTGVWALAIDPTLPTTLYAGLDDISAGGVAKSTDGGMTWNGIGLSGAAVNLLVIAPGHSDVLYAATEGNYGYPRGFRGLYKSTDSGVTWSAVNSGLDDVLAKGSSVTAMAIDPSDSNRLYIGVSGGGVFKSIDGGGSWISFNDGLTNLDVRSLASAPGPRHILFAGTSGGVFKVQDAGPPPDLLSGLRAGSRP